MNYAQLLLNTAKILVNLPSEPNGKEVNPRQLKSKLIFPNYEQDDKKTRISEQEARFAFCHAFEENAEPKLYYSIETPTEKKYSFKRKIIIDMEKGQSAQSDMSIFKLDDSNFKQIINVEFKAHNVELSHIEKDFLKLLAEPHHGLFFHLIKKVGKNTLISENKTQYGILDKYNKSIKKIKINNNNLFKEKILKPKQLVFAICILKPEKYLLTKILKKSDFKNINDIFDLEYSVSKGKIDFTDELKKSNPWNILQILN